MEFLIGRSLMNAMVNLGIDTNCEEALYQVLITVLIVLMTVVSCKVHGT